MLYNIYCFKILLTVDFYIFIWVRPLWHCHFHVKNLAQLVARLQNNLIFILLYSYFSIAYILICPPENIAFKKRKEKRILQQHRTNFKIQLTKINRKIYHDQCWLACLLHCAVILKAPSYIYIRLQCLKVVSS